MPNIRFSTTFRELKPRSIAKLHSFITPWLHNPNTWDQSQSIDSQLKIETDRFGNSYIAEYAVSYAILADDHDLLRDLCFNGANLRMRDRLQKGRTPLELAVAYGRKGCAEILMEYNAPAHDISQPQSPYVKRLALSMWHPVWELSETLQNRQADIQATEELVTKYAQGLYQISNLI